MAHRERSNWASSNINGVHRETSRDVNRPVGQEFTSAHHIFVREPEAYENLAEAVGTGIPSVREAQKQEFIIKGDFEMRLGHCHPGRTHRLTEGGSPGRVHRIPTVVVVSGNTWWETQG